MAKFFKNKVRTKRRTMTQIFVISVCVIGIVLCFFVAYYFNRKLPAGAVIEIRESVAVEVNGEYPDKTTYFSTLENIDEKNIKVDYRKANISKIGEYEVIVKVHNRKYKTILNVVDTFSPELTIKNVSIMEGEKYLPSNFVASCIDNSNEECIVEFYDLAMTQDGEKIDYSHYTTAGTYTVQIVAKDASGNKTTPATATLTITDNPDADVPNEPVDTTEPQGGTITEACKYGGSSYDTEKYILATYVTENGCALDLNLYQDSKVQEPVDALMPVETEKLKKEFQKLGINDTVNLYFYKDAIINTEGKGVVGYSLQVEVSVIVDDNAEIVERYYIDAQGNRTFSVNKYNLV